MKNFVSVSLFISLILTGCAAIDGGPATPPSDFSDGIHSYKFVEKAPFLLDRNYLDVISTYTGQWVNNRPKGRGEAVNNYGLRCTGEFGIEEPVDIPTNIRGGIPDSFSSFNRTAYFVWAKGNVYWNNQLIFSGSFINDFISGKSCLPYGDGVWIQNGWEITGKFSTVVSSREYYDERILVYYEIVDGPCIISYKNGYKYDGNCRAPDYYPNKDSRYRKKGEGIKLEYIDLDEPLILASPSGIFIDINGRKLIGDEARNEVASIQRDYTEKKNEEMHEKWERESAEARSIARHNQAVRESDRAISASIRQMGVENAAIIARIDSQTNDAYAQTNRVLASQAAERKRAREESDERAAQSRRDAERERNTRIASADAQRERDRQAERERAREQEQRREREAQAAAERQAREQEQSRLREEKRQQEARVTAEKQAKAQEQARLLAAKKEAPKNKIIVGEGDSELCFSRSIAEKQAEVSASNGASDECRALGKNWHFKGVNFGGYMGCTACGGGEKGNFRCKVTKATYSCEYW